MTEHEFIQELLALAAAGALHVDEQRKVDQHARLCALCRQELERWSMYSQGLRQLRQPPLPRQLLERTRARILQERATAAERRDEALMVSALAAFTWIVGVAFWLVLRVFSGDVTIILRMNVTRMLTWSVISTVLVWVTAAVAAVVLGRSRHELRRII